MIGGILIALLIFGILILISPCIIKSICKLKDCQGYCSGICSSFLTSFLMLIGISIYIGVVIKNIIDNTTNQNNINNILLYVFRTYFLFNHSSIDNLDYTFFVSLLFY